MSAERDRTSKQKPVMEQESHTSLGEDLPVADNPVGERTRMGKFTGCRRL
jgi:hypothetical protein